MPNRNASWSRKAEPRKLLWAFLADPQVISAAVLWLSDVKLISRRSRMLRTELRTHWVPATYVRREEGLNPHCPLAYLLCPLANGAGGWDKRASTTDDCPCPPPQSRNCQVKRCLSLDHSRFGWGQQGWTWGASPGSHRSLYSLAGASPCKIHPKPGLRPNRTAWASFWKKLTFHKYLTIFLHRIY